MDDKALKMLQALGADEETIKRMAGSSAEVVKTSVEVGRLAHRIAPRIMREAALQAGGDALVGAVALSTAFAWAVAMIGFDDETFERSIATIRTQRKKMMVTAEKMRTELAEARADEMLPDLDEEG